MEGSNESSIPEPQQWQAFHNMKDLVGFLINHLIQMGISPDQIFNQQ
jgi:hypothetical protein